jgi:hypothetical protein
VVVDLVAGTARVVFEGRVAVDAFWAADDRTVIVLDPGDPDTTITAVDTKTGTATTIDHLPRDVQLIAAA